jgi:NAD(P)-dependent dehydrogenase (short-subunit alcohol dehydrogenase family)
VEEWVTGDGYEHVYASNYLGHFLLLQLLFPALTASVPARVTTTSSIMHWWHDADNLTALLPDNDRATASLEQHHFFNRARQYGNTKLLQICMCFELQRRLKEAAALIGVPPGAYVAIAPSLKAGLARERGMMVGAGVLRIAARK